MLVRAPSWSYWGAADSRYATRFGGLTASQIFDFTSRTASTDTPLRHIAITPFYPERLWETGFNKLTVKRNTRDPIMKFPLEIHGMIVDNVGDSEYLVE